MRIKSTTIENAVQTIFAHPSIIDCLQGCDVAFSFASDIPSTLLIDCAQLHSLFHEKLFAVAPFHSKASFALSIELVYEEDGAVLSFSGCQSEGRDKRQEFHFTMPFGFEEIQEKTESFQQRFNILLADDNRENRRYYEAFFTAMGHSLTTVADGVEVLKKMTDEDCDFDLILMDLKMPTMSGFEATQEIRSGQAPLCNIPIIGFTASIDKNISQKCQRIGMDTLLEKPIQQDHFLRVLLPILEAKKEWQTQR
ncbi:response regulator [Temperatibacter marinus]|uniref:Response regulator n=1 Tax=Temperatibacter marinus TaxID=1456591 RepID=A0AA52HAJ4_9PROT|nr:response regulator [Temperatibacter marinus]WND02663.1 response regulator [Temperatibacter marinus]